MPPCLVVSSPGEIRVYEGPYEHFETAGGADQSMPSIRGSIPLSQSNCERKAAAYCQVGIIRAAHESCKSWNPPEAQKEVRATGLGIPADPTLGNMFLASCATNSKEKLI